MLRNNALFFGKKLQKNTVLVRTGFGGASTYFDVSFKHTFLSRNLDQIMLKNALFFEKLEKLPLHGTLPPPVGL